MSTIVATFVFVNPAFFEVGMPVLRAVKNAGQISIKMYIFPTYPSFCPFQASSPPPLPNAMSNQGLVEGVHRACVGPRVAPRELVASAGWRGASQSPCALVGNLVHW